MESSIVESSVDLHNVFAESIKNDFLGSMLQTMFLSPVSILIYGGIAILIIRFILAKNKGKK